MIGYHHYLEEKRTKEIHLVIWSTGPFMDRISPVDVYQRPINIRYYSLKVQILLFFAIGPATGGRALDAEDSS